jgi:uncharacterized protein with FMN-binding domain
MASKHMHRGLVALSASAIAAVYLAGYVRTQSADASIGAAALPTFAPSATAAIAIAAAPAPTATSAPTVTSVAPAQPTVQRSTATPTTTRTPVPSATSNAGLKDGTYTGQGTSRRGDVWVSVDVQSGRIATVTITRSTLQYPLRDIAGLPDQVVQRQSAQVDIVSRATYSSQAFRTAVSQALSKAG